MEKRIFMKFSLKRTLMFESTLFAYFMCVYMRVYSLGPLGEIMSYILGFSLK